MARKNIFATPAPEPAASDVAPAEAPPAGNRPLLNLAIGQRDIKKSSPLGVLGQSLESLSRRAERADEIERRLTEGQTIVELDPASIDASFVEDRMQAPAESLASLVASMRDSGQQVPILVRPHPVATGRYQVAYGHRRRRAAAELGIKVRAVVRELSDTQLVVAQGQENNERADLSYIERARFAATLEARGFDRETIMAALSVDKAALSKMISIATRVPATLIGWIGPAPQHGRHRWWDLSELLQVEANVAKVMEAIGPGDEVTLTSDERFDKLMTAILRKTSAPEAPRSEPFVTNDGTALGKITRGAKSVSVQIDTKIGADFGEFLIGSLPEIYDRYKAGRR